MKLANYKLGKKIAFAFGIGVLGFLLLTGLSLWSVHAIHRAMTAAEKESHMTVLAQKISSDLGAIAQNVATMTQSGETDRESMARLTARRTAYLAAFDEVKAADNTEAGKGLLGQAERVA